jgi:recyclin-1
MGTCGEYHVGVFLALDYCDLRNYPGFSSAGQLDFSPMDKFMSHILEAMEKHGALATRVFPPASRVLPSFADRIANDVIQDYITQLLNKARETSTVLYLQAAAASFIQAWRLVGATRAAAGKNDKVITQTQAEDIMYVRFYITIPFGVHFLKGKFRFRMFEQHMDEYLDEETEIAKNTFDNICKTWERKVCNSDLEICMTFILIPVVSWTCRLEAYRPQPSQHRQL